MRSSFFKLRVISFRLFELFSKSLKVAQLKFILGSLEKDVSWSGCWGKYYEFYIRFLLWSCLLWTVKSQLTAHYEESHNLYFFATLFCFCLRYAFIIVLHSAWKHNWIVNCHACRKCVLYLSDFTFQILALSQQNWWAF